MFICPFWNQKDHVGTIRAERLVRWMMKLNLEVIIVTAGHKDAIQKTDFGNLIIINDPLRIYPDVFGNINSQDTSSSARKPNKFRRWMAYFLLVPDLHIRWAKAVLKSNQVYEMAKACNYFMASSPPESSFIAACELSLRYGGKFIMDMRDGWLDEPMKPLLKSIWLQRYREKRIEKKLLNKADTICVTSENWKDLMINRYPDFKAKIHTIPNCYPEYSGSVQQQSGESVSQKRNCVIQLLHAGRITSSRPERNIEYLLERLLQYIGIHNLKINIKFLGALDSSEIEVINTWNKRFNERDGSLVHVKSVDRFEALKMMEAADGLLMVSNSYASIPAKYYDYSVVGRPVLNLTINNSASANVSSKQHHFYNLIESDSSGLVTSDSQIEIIESFINHCRSNDQNESFLNPDYTENVVFNRFGNLINSLEI